MEIVINKKILTIKDLFLTGLTYAVILLVALMLYYETVCIAQLLTNQFGVFFRRNAWTGQERSVLDTFILVTKNIGIAFLNFNYLPVLEMVVFSVIGFVLFPFLSIRRKSWGLLLCWLAFFGGNFLIHYINGSLMYRGAQTFCLYIAFVALILIEQLKTVAFVKKPLIVFVVFLTLIQSADMNRWFWNDYLRYKKDSFAVHSIATELVSDYDTSKPVVFTNGWYSFSKGGYLHTHYIQGGQANGNSAVYWGAGNLSGDIEVLHLFFRMEGYDFLVMPTQEQIDSANAESKGMPCYPNIGYIKESENYIIVNMGAVPG